MTSERRQEKVGWIGGWLGSFAWIPILAAVVLAQGRGSRSAVGLLIAAAAVAAIFALAPWRYPDTRYRMLMLPIYGLFFAGVVWGVWALGDPRQMGLNSWWSLLVLLPATIPLWIAGNRRWCDGATGQPGSQPP